MNPRKGYCSLVQYCPDLARNESVNIGVVLLVPEAGFLQARLVRDNARVRHCFNVSGDALSQLKEFKRSFVRRVEAEGGKIRDLEQLEHFIATRGNFIQLTEPRYVKVRECEAELDRLFSVLVGGEGKKKKKRRRLEAKLRQSFEKGGVADRIRRDIPLTVPVLDRLIRVPFGFQNGAFQLLQPARFLSASEGSNFATACKYSIEGGSVQETTHEQLGDVRFNVIGRFNSKKDPSIPVVRRALQENSVQLYLEHELPDLIDQIRRTAKPLPS